MDNFNKTKEALENKIADFLGLSEHKEKAEKLKEQLDDMVEAGTEKFDEIVLDILPDVFDPATCL